MQKVGAVLACTPQCVSSDEMLAPGVSREGHARGGIVRDRCDWKGLPQPQFQWGSSSVCNGAPCMQNSA